MDLPAKIRSLPTSPGVYLYKNAEDEIIYVGKAKNLRSRVGSYFHEGRWEDAKTGTLVREAVDVDYIVVTNNREALALENHFIKQKKPRFNILLRDDKTYPYVKLTLAERFPRVYVTRRLRKDGSVYYGPYFPANLAYRIVDLIHRHFCIPSCKVDLTRFHSRPCLQYYIKRCLGPCVQNLTTPEAYTEAVFAGSKLVSAIGARARGRFCGWQWLGADNAIAAGGMFHQLYPRRDAEPARECVICLPLKTPVRRLESLKMEVGDDLSRQNRAPYRRRAPARQPQSLT